MTEPGMLADRSDPAAQRIADVTKPARGRVRTALIEDLEPLLQSISAGVSFSEVYAIEGVGFPDQLTDACRARDIPMRLVGTGLAHQLFKSEKRPKAFGVAAVPEPLRMNDLAEATGDLVVLDGVKIVGNIGAIVRTSYALGAGGVVLVDSDLTTIADRRLVRASRGYAFSLPVVLASRVQAVEFFRRTGIQVIDFAAGAPGSLADLASEPERVALLMGGEKRGTSDDFGSVSATSVAIPMNPAAESLNVSVSAGIALYARAGRNLR